MQLPAFSDYLSGSTQLIGFIDSGAVAINNHSWAEGNNHRTLSGAGIGLNWSGPEHWVVKSYYAQKLGNQAAVSAPDSSGRFWLQAAKYF
jgi:hemolysin activation/secretion protein